VDNYLPSATAGGRMAALPEACGWPVAGRHTRRFILHGCLAHAAVAQCRLACWSRGPRRRTRERLASLCHHPHQVVLHGCRSHVAPAAWLRQPCTKSGQRARNTSHGSGQGAQHHRGNTPGRRHPAPGSDRQALRRRAAARHPVSSRCGRREGSVHIGEGSVSALARGSLPVRGRAVALR